MAVERNESRKFPREVNGLGPTAFHLLDRLLPRTPAIDGIINRIRFWRAHGRLPRPVTSPCATFNDLIFARMSQDDWMPLERAAIDKQHAKMLATALSPQVRTPATRKVFRLNGPGDAEWLAERLEARKGQPEIAKSTHGSGTVLFLRGCPSSDSIRAFSGKAVRSFYSISRESQYRGQERKVILEDDLSERGVPPDDFKFFCVRGNVLFCQVDTGRFRNHLRSLVTSGFEPIDVRYAHDMPPQPPARPANFDDMLAIARDLSRPFGFVRIDLYSTGNAVYFGEFTFAPEGGTGSLSHEDFGISVMEQIRKGMGREEDQA